MLFLVYSDKETSVVTMFFFSILTVTRQFISLVEVLQDGTINHLITVNFYLKNLFFFLLQLFAVFWF